MAQGPKRLAKYAGDVKAVLSSQSSRWLALFSLGIGSILLWSTVPLFLAPLRVGIGAVLFGSPAFIVTYFVTQALTMLARLALPDGRLRRALFAPGPPQAVAGSVGGLALAVAGLFPDRPPLMYGLGCAGAALAAFMASCSFLGASRLLKELSPARSTVACTGAFLVAGVLTVALAFARSVAFSVVFAFVPLATCELYRRCNLRIPYADLARGPEGSMAVGSFKRHDAWRYAAIFLSVFLMGVYVLAYAGSTTHLPASLPAPAVALLSVGVLAALSATVVVLQAYARSISYALICRVCIPAIAVAMALTYTPEGNAGYLDVAAACLVFVALLVCDLFCWIVDVCVVRSRSDDGMRLFAALRVGMCLGAVLAVLSVAAPWESADKPKVGLVITFVVLVVSVACLPSADIRALPLAQANPSSLRALDDDQRDRWSPAIVSHGLTARESEVFVLLVQDVDAPGIAAELGISRATVNTHVQHIYAKFGVHSRKELAALLGDGAR